MVVEGAARYPLRRLRKKLGMGKRTGVLLTHVDLTGSCYGILREGDVILEARAARRGSPLHLPATWAACRPAG